MQPTKAILCWSGGKDSSLCLYEVQQSGAWDVQYLLSTVNENFKRLSMHGVREELLELQAEATGIPLLKMYVKESSNAEYEENLTKSLLQAKAADITHVIYGDIFLEDLRKYREDHLAKLGMTAVFPLWKRDTRQLMKTFAELKFKTVICCVNDLFLGKEAAGQELDEKFLKNLPAGIDPCGENGEFHSFCYEGPIFNKPIRFVRGEKVYKPLQLVTDTVPANKTTKGFWYCDLLPVPA